MKSPPTKVAVAEEVWQLQPRASGSRTEVLKKVQEDTTVEDGDYTVEYEENYYIDQ